MTEALAAGREELGLLLYASQTPAWLERRTADGRSTSELRADWLRKVIAAGLDADAALDFLNRRIALEEEQPQLTYEQ